MSKEGDLSASVSETLSISDRLSAVYKELAASADVLAEASDAFGQPIRQAEVVLQQLNIGLDTWVKIAGGEDDEGNYWRREIGYVKFWDGWKLAIRKMTGNHGRDQDTEDTWSFNEAPRSLRIEAFDKLPELLEHLIDNANKTAKKLKEKTLEAQGVVNILKQAAMEVKEQKEAAKQQKKEKR